MPVYYKMLENWLKCNKQGVCPSIGDRKRESDVKKGIEDTKRGGMANLLRISGSLLDRTSIPVLTVESYDIGFV